MKSEIKENKNNNDPCPHFDVQGISLILVWLKHRPRDIFWDSNRPNCIIFKEMFEDLQTITIFFFGTEKHQTLKQTPSAFHSTNPQKETGEFGTKNKKKLSPHGMKKGKSSTTSTPTKKQTMSGVSDNQPFQKREVMNTRATRHKNHLELSIE